jgi:putative RNA 2'-phosphotransferase
MSASNHKASSKFLSLVLRHKPEAIGISLDENGWASTEELLSKTNANGHSLTLEELKEIVRTNDKKRFAFSEDFTRIGASQGHSVEVDLQLRTIAPPDVLYHGTAEKNIASIKQRGLLKGSSNHVHLSSDAATARKVGSRYGKPIVLTIDAKGMHEEGHQFFQSENGVWLTEQVPLQYITNSAY